LCRCAKKGKFSSAAATVDARELLAALSTAKRGDVFSLEFGPDDLRDQQTVLFVPNLFNVQPKVLSVSMTIEVIGRGKRPKEKDERESDRSPSLSPETVELSITGTTVLDSFTVTNIGETGQNTETFVAGTVLFTLKKRLFEGLVTAVLTNDIWTKDDPIVLVEGFGGDLNRDTNTFTFTTGAPDDSFIVPTISAPND
jgi:hypothetical protein